MTGQGDMIYVPPARFVSGSRVFVTPYMEGVRSVPAPLKGTEFEGEGTVPQIPICGIPVQGLSCKQAMCQGLDKTGLAEVGVIGDWR